jgi:predicted metal-dependent phosphoesterase TrpH
MDKEQAMTPDTRTEAEARCPRCDLTDCPWPAAWKAPEGQPGFGKEQTPESEAAWIALGRAVLECDAKPIEYWRAARDAAVAERDSARAVALEACDLAEEGWAYAGEYFRDKWDAGGRLANLRMSLDPALAGAKP